MFLQILKNAVIYQKLPAAFFESVICIMDYFSPVFICKSEFVHIYCYYSEGYAYIRYVITFHMNLWCAIYNTSKMSL